MFAILLVENHLLIWKLHFMNTDFCFLEKLYSTLLIKSIYLCTHGKTSFFSNFEEAVDMVLSSKPNKHRSASLHFGHLIKNFHIIYYLL